MSCSSWHSHTKATRTTFFELVTLSEVRFDILSCHWSQHSYCLQLATSLSYCRCGSSLTNTLYHYGCRDVETARVFDDLNDSNLPAYKRSTCSYCYETCRGCFTLWAPHDGYVVSWKVFLNLFVPLKLYTANAILHHLLTPAALPFMLPRPHHSLFSYIAFTSFKRQSTVTLHGIHDFNIS